jgi:hypothetical protein
MKEFLLVFLQLLLFSVLASQNISFLFVPNESSYSLSIENKDNLTDWKTMISLDATKGVSVRLPVTASLYTESGLFTFGKEALWDKSRLCSFLTDYPALMFSNEKVSLSVTNSFLQTLGPRVFELELPLGNATFSLFNWAWGSMNIEKDYLYLTTWDTQKAEGGWGGNLSLQSDKAQAFVELVYTNITGLEAVIEQTLVFPMGQLTVCYGEKTYPKRYKVDLTYREVGLSAQYSFENEFGGMPVFGGEFQMRRTHIKASIRKEIRPWFLSISSLDEETFDKEGKAKSQRDLYLTLGKQESEQQYVFTCKLREKQSDSEETGHVFAVDTSLKIADILFSYSEQTFSVSLSHVIPLEHGELGFQITQSQGKRNSLSISYSTTIDR